MIPIEITASTSKLQNDVVEAKIKSSRLFEDLVFLIEDAEYGDAANLVSNNKSIPPKLAKLVIELNELSDLAPKNIIERREQEILSLISEGV